MAYTKIFPICFLLTASLLFINLSVYAQEQYSQPGTDSGYYVFCYFMNNGEDGVHYAVSRDGYKWNAVNDNKSILPPPFGKNTNLTRDPSICRGEDGTFHLVWTVSWDGRSFGHASSTDLINWEDAHVIPCMQDEPMTRNTWAPEVFYDKKEKQYYILWSSTIPGRFSPVDQGTSESKFDHRVYYNTTKDFKTFSKTKLYFDPKHNTIDAFLSENDGKYLLFYKDETLFPVEKKIILVAESDNPTGPFTEGRQISAQSWVEGPSALSIGKDLIVYYDCYRDGKYGAVRSRDGKTWEDIANQISFPKGTRHGTAFEVDQETYERLVEKYGIAE